MNPKAKIVQTHGCVEDEWTRGLDAIRDMYTVVAELDNVYMETGGWCEKQFEVAFEVGVTADHLMWGHDYGNVPQHIVRRGVEKYGPKPKALEYRNTMSLMMFGYKDWPAVPTYQPDFYGWGLRTVDRVGDWLTQDEINLILGGTAARLYKLPVPYPRMFPEGRPDIFGDKLDESIPFIPREQIEVPRSGRSEDVGEALQHTSWGGEQAQERGEVGTETRAITQPKTGRPIVSPVSAAWPYPVRYGRETELLRRRARGRRRHRRLSRRHQRRQAGRQCDGDRQGSGHPERLRGRRSGPLGRGLH